MTMMTEKKVLVLIGSATYQDADAQTIQATSKEEVTAARKDIFPASIEHLQFAIQSSELASLYDPMELSGWQSLLKPGASISIRVLVADSKSSPDLKPIHTSFLLAGLSGVSERLEADLSRVFEVTKKAPKTYTSVQINKKVIVNDLDDGELLDEDDLLNEEGNGLWAPPSMVPTTMTAGSDCSGRKACDDCTCGRAELEGGAEIKQVKSSSCGNCGKGDAFRCAGCPYLGKPAFKAGEEYLVLDLLDDIE